MFFFFFSSNQHELGQNIRISVISEVHTLRACRNQSQLMILNMLKNRIAKIMHFLFNFDDLLSNALTLRVRAYDATKSQRTCIILSQFTRKKVKNTRSLIYNEKCFGYKETQNRFIFSCNFQVSVNLFYF